MKFRLKWRLRALCLQIPAAASALVWATGRNLLTGHLIHIFGQIAFNLLLMGVILGSGRAFTIWEMDSTALRECWFGFKAKEFVWGNIIRVGLTNYERPNSCEIQIEYTPFSAARTCWRAVTVNPAQRDQFIAAMRQFAKTATFDV